MTPTRSSRHSPLHVIGSTLGLLAAVALGWLAFTRALPPQQFAGTDSDQGQGDDEGDNASIAAPPALEPCLIEGGGYWRGTLVGSRSLAVDWSGSALDCAGNARPGDRGVRLFFAGKPAEGSERLVLIIGIAAVPEELAGREHGASVTVIDEASSRFFNAGDDRCFTRVSELRPLDQEKDQEKSKRTGIATYRIAGELYCLGAIASVADDTAVTLGDTAYAGRLTLAAVPSP